MLARISLLRCWSFGRRSLRNSRNPCPLCKDLCKTPTAPSHPHEGRVIQRADSQQRRCTTKGRSQERIERAYLNIASCTARLRRGQVVGLSVGSTSWWCYRLLQIPLQRYAQSAFSIGSDLQCATDPTRCYGAYGPYFPREASPSRGGAEARSLRLRLGLASLLVRAGLGVGAGRPHSIGCSLVDLCWRSV